MAAVVNNQGSRNAWGLMKEYFSVVYDFSLDAGATGSLDLFTASEDMVVTNCYLKVKTAGTSGGSATVAIGKSGDAGGLVSAANGAVANLTLGAVIKGAATAYKLAAADVVQLTIATAALTAGKVEIVFECSRF